MKSWLYVALLAQVVFFAGWGVKLLTSHRDAAVVWLATEPVDPRDLLSGNYVALRYAVASTHCERGSDPPTGAAIPVWVQLVVNGDEIPTAEGGATLASAIECRTTPPDPGDGAIWMLGRLDSERNRISFGIERMFVGEDNPLRQATSGTVVAQVAINDAYEPRLLALVSRSVK